MKGHVQVYRNLNRKFASGKPVFSVRNDKGLVEDHVASISLLDPVFRVSKAGNERVRKEKRKNVHAYVSGQLGRPAGDLEGYSLDRAYYNPYKNEFFVNDKGEELRGKYEKVIITGKQIYYK